MATERLKFRAYMALIGLALLLGGLALALLGQTAQNSEQFGRLHGILLAINAAGAAVLLGLIAGNLVRLVRDYRQRAPGARLKARMVLAFLGLSLAPILLIYYFAVQFLNQGIDTWFDVRVEEGLTDALRLGRASLDLGMRQDLATSSSMARELAAESEFAFPMALSRMLWDSGALELTVFDDQRRILATVSRYPGGGLPALPAEELILRLRQDAAYLSLDPSGDGSYVVRSAVPIPVPRTRPRIYLGGVFPVEGQLSSLADSVQSSYTRYGELVFLREPLKYSFTLTLTVVVLLSFLAAVAGAFFFSRQLVAPVQSLVAGTRAVAKGDFDTRLPIQSDDEMGFLIDSFNDMIRRLSDARRQARQNEEQVERERARLEAVLAGLSTGVLALDRDLNVTIANQAAGEILSLNFGQRVGTPLSRLSGESALMAQFVEACEKRFESDSQRWREEIFLATQTGRRVLNCTCTTLSGEEGVSAYVLVFDDVTGLLQAQRDAAWGEVARRLAHEIKNPLTPIQLAAERIRRRYLDRMQDMEAEVLDRATHTIVQQVEAMRDMVNAFSEYARAPEMNIARVDLNGLIQEVTELYRLQDSHSAIRLDLDQRLEGLDADAVRLRQVLHNLVRNALEALEHQEPAQITISTTVLRDGARDSVEIRVQDNGPGFDRETLEKVFEPYVTTKIRGTGLGMAIVKKLVEEHGGSISAENHPEGGACITVRLPIHPSRGDNQSGPHRETDNRRESA